MRKEQSNSLASDKKSRLRARVSEENHSTDQKKWLWLSQLNEDFQ